MNRVLRTGILTLALCFTAGVVVLPAMAQGTHAAAQTSSHAKSRPEVAQSNGPAEGMDAPETEKEHHDYEYSPSVQWLAKRMGISMYATAQIFEWLNSGILLFVIFFFLFKALPGIFRRRREQLSKDLVEAQQVSGEAKRRLSVIEERLSHLDAEIEAFRKRSEHEAAEEERRMHETLEEERVRIVHSAEQEIDAASAVAQRNLRRYAAELAVGQVRSSLKVGMDRDKALVAEFADSITANHPGRQS